ncbi:hypothetical protein GGR53DRAFT_529628 [Hypoxylon sp. FL1150]|nr:hypothetical protein GGR53DRAFT_529628 [Hypoxylon sp. FL1150]
MDPNAMSGGWKPVAGRFGDVVGDKAVVSQAAINFQTRLGDFIPWNYGFDFLPALEAFIENCRTIQYQDDANGRRVIRPVVNMAPLVATVKGSSLVPKHTAALNKHFIDPDKIDKTKMVPKRPGMPGGWNYVWYVPEWTHPDFDPSITVSYNFPGVQWLSADTISKMYPALRVEDLVKNPTDWAKRFGIYPDELGGRSRLSPTLSQTRDPFQDYANQINQLSDEGRRQAVEASRARARELGAGGDYIAPEVLEAILTSEGRLSAKQLREELEKNLGPQKDKKMNLDVFVEAVNAKKPLIYDAHSNFLTNALADQDLQRLIFNEMTSDELVWDNVFTMSNDVQYDLKGDIHHLFERGRWHDTSAKGIERYLPRLMYNLGGQRMEWDVLTNNELWEALQPSLLLLTKILATNPAGMKRIYDMSNRRQLPVDMDNRGVRLPPRASVYGVEDELEGYDKYWEIERLEELGYNWEENVNRILNDYLHIDIGSGYISPVASKLPEAVDGAHEMPECPYGVTTYYEDNNIVHFTITVSAEMIWPLLMPQFSESEKMTAAFGVAVTLLHELGHAVNMAQYILTTTREARQPNQQPEVVGLLWSLGRQLWSTESQNEPFLMGHANSECGFDLEASIFGYTAFNMMMTRYTQYARQIKNIPLMLAGHQYPFRSNPHDVPLNGDSDAPVESYMSPMTIDWISKFFRQDFWDQFVARIGPEALKLRPGDRILKTIMTPEYGNPLDLIDAYGAEEAKFLSCCQTLFQTNRNGLTAEYIAALAEQPILLRTMKQRWSIEIQEWEGGILEPLEDSTARLLKGIKDAGNLQRLYEEKMRNLPAHYDAYLQRHQSQVPPPEYEAYTLDGYRDENTRIWKQMFRPGGTLMRAVVETYNYMAKDVTKCQRMVFDFFSLNPEARSQVYKGLGAGDSGIIGVVYARLIRFHSFCPMIVTHLRSVSTYDRLESQKKNWELWARLFSRCDTIYSDLLAMLGNMEQYNPGDIQWKRRFASVPSSYWKSRLDRLRTMMQKEYVKMDPRLRGLVDECDAIVRRFRGAGGMAPPLQLDETQIETVTNVLTQMRNLGSQLPIESLGPFQWTAPIAGGTVDPANLQARPATRPVQPQHNTFSGAVFGQPGQIIGVPPVRTTQAPNPFTNTQGASPFQGLATNTPSPFGSGGSFPTTNADETAFRQRPADSREFQAPIFGDPYARSTTTTADLQYYQALRDEAADAQLLLSLQSNTGHAPYATNEQWRETQPVLEGETSQVASGESALPSDMGAINTGLDGTDVGPNDINMNLNGINMDLNDIVDLPNWQYGLPDWVNLDMDPDSMFDAFLASHDPNNPGQGT